MMPRIAAMTSFTEVRLNPEKTQMFLDVLAVGSSRLLLLLLSLPQLLLLVFGLSFEWQPGAILLVIIG